MAILNITFRGVSADVPVELDPRTTDGDLRRIAVELVRSGGIPGLHISELEDRAFASFLVDRFDTPLGGKRIYLRPKVPFGAG